MSDPSQQPQKGFYLGSFLRSSSFKLGLLSQPCVITPPMGVCGNHSLTSFYGQLAMSSFSWPIVPYWCFMAVRLHLLSLANYSPKPHLWPQAISCSHWPFLPILHLSNPQANSFVLGLGGPSGLPGAFTPSSHHQGLWAHPFDYGGLGLSGLFGPFRPPTASMVHRPWSVGPLGPFWPK
ncbi:hypothetical protein O181_101427 [Austropuccinia psidii MF-1]|uniref:Uncharacterized protein n=1 Tax=Austropuccinia psidii MF-1 TaxID=1389203 RepID=A0A9Q3PII5_9BASI|nr:hypothetical protein [Austropuccinia psidii MF-1]